ncbi:uncharacterized protein LOC123499934 [Portunus trituberculatus]|uniref:uncharacterized protein LOC123499934 n=1 Tax=Portunus trituberculatus TaxID=210409 RepID=UPI001E1D01CF|nr:uncharacterized protein LOC123499934 [Portunus trituberculatus]
MAFDDSQGYAAVPGPSPTPPAAGWRYHGLRRTACERAQCRPPSASVMGASSLGTQFKCSLWRHYLGHLRQWAWVVGALVVALTPFALLAGLKSTASRKCRSFLSHFEARGLTTEWPLGLLQSFVCGMSNECQEEGQDDLVDHYPGAASHCAASRVNELINATYLIDDSSRDSLMDRLFALPRSLNLLKGLTDLITTPALSALMVKSPSELAAALTSEHNLDPAVVEAFLESRINVSRVFSLAGVRGPKEVVCSPQYLAEFLVTNSSHLVTELSWSLCHLPLSKAANVTAVFLASLDPGKLITMVGEVIETAGGYNAQILMEQIGSLVGAVGRLEGLASLASSLSPVLSALQPLRKAMEVLSLSMWDEVSLGDFLEFVGDVVHSLSTNSSRVLTEALEEATDATLHLLALAKNPSNFTSQLEGLGDPWEAVLTDIGVTTEAIVGEVEAASEYLRQHPVQRSLLSLTATGLSTLLHNDPYNDTRLEWELDEVLNTLLEESQIPLNTTFARTLLPTLHSAKVFTRAVDGMAALVVKDPPLPLTPSLSLLTLLSNCSQLKNAVDGEGLAAWLCSEESVEQWGVEEHHSYALSGRLCSAAGRLSLQISHSCFRTLSITPSSQGVVWGSEEPQDTITPSEVIDAVMDLLKTLNSSTHLQQALNLTESVLTPSLDLECGGFQDLTEGVKDSKYIIQRLVSIYLNLVGGGCGGASGSLATVLPSGKLENVADIVTSVLDTLVHLAAVTQDPWLPGDLLRHPNMTSFLTRILPPNVMMVVTRGLEVAQSPWVEVPAPLPQLLTLLNATRSALVSVLVLVRFEGGRRVGVVWEGGCPHLASLMNYTHLLPHLLALPYFSSIVKPGEEEMQILASNSSWRYYPCQLPVNATSASLALFFPPTSSFTATSQPTIEKVKEDVKELEDYLCENFDVVLDELTSNEELTSAVKAFMDDLTPDQINLGSAVGLLRSLWHTVTLLDIPELANNLTGGSLTLTDWEKPFNSLAVNNSDPKRFLMEELGRMLERLLDEEMWNGTRVLYSSINLGLHAAQNISTALTHILLEGDVSLSELFGVSPDDPLFSRLLQGPQGLADILLTEINTTVIAAMLESDIHGWLSGAYNHSSSNNAWVDIHGWLSGACNRSSDKNAWVELLCNFTLGEPVPKFVRSNLTETVSEAVVQFSQPLSSPPPPPVSPSQFLTSLENLGEALRQFDFTKPPDMPDFELLVNTSQWEANRLLAGLRVIEQEWPFLLLDALVQRGPVEVQAVVRETDFALSLLLQGLPPSDANTTITELYQLLNTSWVDLLAGIHHNIHRELALETLTVENVCGGNSTLEEPEGGDGRFLEAVEKLCLFVSSNPDIFEEVKYLQNTSAPLPSTKTLYSKSHDLASSVQQVVVAARDQGVRDVLGWPSFFVTENWKRLLDRIYPDATDGITTEGLEELVPSLVLALGWLGVPQNSTFPKNIVLQIKWMNLLLAQDLDEVLNGTVVLSGLADTLTDIYPGVLRDIVHTLAQRPDKVGEALMALQGVESWAEVCQLNASAMGSDIAALQKDVCQVEGEALVQELRGLLGLDLLLQPDPIMTLEDALKLLMVYISTLNEMDRIGTPLTAPGGLVEYLGLQQWMNVSSDVFNVTLEEMEANSTVILAGVLGPLVERVARTPRRVVSLETSCCPSVVTSDRHVGSCWHLLGIFLDLLDHLPEITEEYISLLSRFSLLSEVVKMPGEPPCAFQMSLLERLAEVEGVEVELLNQTIQFFCNYSTPSLWMQLNPGYPPVIMAAGEVVPEMAFLGLSAARTHSPPWWVNNTLPQVASALYQLSLRLAQSINETTGTVDLEAAVQDLGSVKEVVAFMAPRLPTLVSLALWLPESYASWRFFRGDHWLEIVEEMCEKGPEHLLLYPGLPQQEWDALRHTFCNLSLPQLGEDLEPLFNVTEVMEGETVNLSKVKEAVGQLMRRLAFLDPFKLDDPFSNNAYTLTTTRFGPVLKIIQGTLGQLIWLYRGTMERMSKSSQFLTAHSLAMAMGAVEPITSDRDHSLLERLVDPALFLQLVKDYQNVQQRMHDTAVAQVESPDYDSVESYPLYGQVYSDLHSTLLNLTESLAVPLVPGVRVPLGQLLESILYNTLYNGGEILKIQKDVQCYRPFQELILREEHWVMMQQWVEVVERQLLGRVEDHVELMCRAPSSNLTQLLRGLWEELDWKEEVTKTIDSAVAGNTTTTCNALIDQIIATYEKFLEVVQQYERDEGARTHLSDCLSDAIHSDAGQQLIGLMVAARDLLRSVSSSANLTRTFSSSLRSIGVSRSLRKLATRVAVMAPLQEVLVRDYNEKLNMSGRVLEATRHLKVDVNRIYPGDVEELAVLSETLEDMQKWWKVMESEGANHSSTWGPEEETPLEILHKFTMSRGPDVFAADLLDAVNYTYLLREVGNMRTKAVLSLTWLDSLVSHLSVAAESLTELTQSGSVMDLDKMISGEDPVAFLSESVEFIHLEQWSHLAKSFQGLLEEGVPLLTGSQLGDDLQSVVDGVNSILAVRDMGLLDFNVPITSFIANWTKLEDYLLSDLKMEPSVVEALSTSHFNLLSLLSLEGSSVEEVLCGGHQMERFVVLPANTDVTPAQLTSTLCSTNDTQALATSFLSHLTLTPLMTLLTKFGVNASLSSHGLSLERCLSTCPHPTTLRAFHNLSDILLAPPQAEKLVDNRTVATIGDITSPQFLERAGQALCGRPLKLMPDRLRLKETKVKKSSSSDEELEVCERLHKDLRSLPGGGLLLHYIKPLLTGKIFFTPDNTITRAIIAKANETFEAVDRQQQNLRKMSQEAKGMTSSSTNEFDLKRLEDALQSPWVQGAMKELLQSAPSPVSSLKLSSLPSVPSLMANLKEATPQLLESSELIREFSDVLEVGVSLMSCLQLQRFVPVSNESQLLEEAHEAVERKEFLAGIVFQGVGESGSTETALPADLTYTIRVDYSKSPPTFLLGPKFWRPGPYSDVAFYMRYQQGFVQLQETLEHAILKLYHQQAKAGQGTAGERRKRSVNSPLPLTEEEEDLLLNLPVHTKQQPYPCYTKDDFLQMVNESPVMSFIFSFLSLVLFSTFIIQQLVQERESRNKQLQEVMGLRLWLDHLVWLLCSLLLLLIIVLLSTFLLSFGGLQPRADFGLLMLFLFCYGLSVVSFCYLVACLIPTTVLAVFTGVMMLLVFNIPFVSISVIQATVPLSALILTCLLPSTAFGFGFRIICQYELVEVGANYANLWIPPTKGSEMTLGLAISMLLLDTLIFFIITVITNHFRNDAPRQRSGEDGAEATNKRCSFMQHFSGKQTNDFTLNMFPECRVAKLSRAPDPKVTPGKDDVTSIKKEAVHVVDLDLGLKQSLQKGLSISGLRKIYHQSDSESRVAVDGLTLDLYEGQVLALLGHNGAGKTTIISMLTHEVKPTAGKIEVYGEDVSTREGWERARQMIGLCPQESVLFPLMTVEETLAYYTALKQRPSDPHPLMVLANMDLLEHRHYMSHQLSEGLRRRLCMALAFVGNSKLVVLDEPTSGIDPAARSIMWEVISNNRSGRTILLTTHHLDEAETLADRVAVLHKGRLLCVGSPLALKSEHGIGYSITLSKSNQAPHLPPTDKTDTLNAFKEKSALSYCELPLKVHKPNDEGFGSKEEQGKDKTWELLTQYVPNTRLLESVNGEVTYSLPINDAAGNTNRLPELFGELESRLGELGYVSMELRPTSLEDVIITLNTINTFESTSTRSSIRVEAPLTSQKDLTTTYDFSLQPASCCVGLRRLFALLHKRLLHHSRDWHFYVQMFLLPFLFILLAMVASKLRPSFSKAKPITLTSSVYPPPATTFIRTLDPTLEPLAEEVTRLSLGLENRARNWSSCPDFVADTNPGIAECSVPGSSVQSSCQCVEERCVVEASGQPSLNDWILATRTEHVQSRHGGITLGVRDPREGEEGRSGALVWYDNAAYHALPAYINLLNNARLQRLAGPHHSITAINHPIVFTLHGMWSMSIQQHVADLGIGLLVLVALTVVCSATAGCVVAERVRGERRLLHLAGLSKKTYWIGSALWDTAVVVLNIVLISMVFLAFKEQQFIWRENLAAFVFLALLYGLSILPLFYLLEGWFRTEASAVFFFFCSFFGVGLITTLLLVVCQVMSYIKEGDYERASAAIGMNDTAAVIKYVFLVFPPFAFTCSLKDMAASYTRASIMARFDMDLYQSPFTWDSDLQGGLGVYMVALSVWALVGWVLLLIPRPRLVPGQLPVAETAEEDQDVAAERIKIQCGGTSLYDTVLRLVGLGRDFSSPRITAVGNLFLAVRRGECFSLLGLNGAGKTTTFRCLTGDLQPSRGQILVNGLLLEEALELPTPILSYCPQGNALDPNLTPREVLTNMARIRGASGPRTNKVVQQAIKQLGLSNEANTYVRHLSGGNKRKVSVALSLLGNPLLVLMDEPTTGMDPASRRLVWRAIQSVSQDSRSVLLTSHSMDEVNQLSHRMAIMVNGQFVCLGSPHYLKHRLGDKYTVRLKTRDIEDMTYVVDYLRSHLKEVLLKEQHHLSLVVEVSRQMSLQLIFDTLNAAKSLGITEYDVSQTTLNEVFRVLTSHQSDGLIPLPVNIAQSRGSIPSLLPHHQLARIKPLAKDNTFQHPSILAPVECINPTAPYGNFEYPLKGYERGGSLPPESRSASDSPEEEWTKL